MYCHTITYCQQKQPDQNPNRLIHQPILKTQYRLISLNSIDETLSDGDGETTDSKTETDSEDTDAKLTDLYQETEDISDGRFILYNYKLLSHLFANINQYKCTDCELDGRTPSGYNIHLNTSSKFSVGASRAIDLFCSSCGKHCNRGTLIVTSP